MYNKFKNILLKHYDASFPISYVNKKITKNELITIGIKKSLGKDSSTMNTSRMEIIYR